MAALFSNALAYENLMGRWSVRLAPLFAQFTQVADGARVLDVGCGTGSLARTLVSMTRRSEIVGIDPVAPFVEYARSQVKDSRVSFEVGDAQALPYPPASFDCALSLLVFHFIPDADKAARELRRVTRPGGTVAACTWDRRGMEMSALFWEVAGRLDPDAEAKRPERLNQAGQLGELWRAAGLRDVDETELEISMDFGSFEDYWAPLEKGVGPQGAYLVALAPERRQALRQALEAHLRARGAPGAFALRAKALAVRGRA
jgi:SAM-dependent methyltransferase